MATAILDLIGVVLLGAVTLALLQLAGGPPAVLGGKLGPVINSLVARGSNWVLMVGAVAAILLIAKSWVSAYLTWRTLTYLGRLQARVSDGLARKLFSSRLDWIRLRTSQTIVWALLLGCSAATIGLLGAASLALAELSLLVALGVVLILVDPLATLVALTFFGLVAGILQWALGGWAGRLGRRNSLANTQVIQRVQEGVETLRELIVLGRVSAMLTRLNSSVAEAGATTARLNYAANLPKYIYESALLLGAVGLGVLAFSTRTTQGAIVLITVFLAAATRILPSALRLQNYVLSIRSSAGMASVTFDLADDLVFNAASPRSDPASEVQQSPTSDFVPEVLLRGVNARYVSGDDDVLRGIDLTVDAGQMIAIVGPTGSGKSTLVDVVLGITPPSEGKVLISGMAPSVALASFPGSIGYVPQSVILVTGTVWQNVALHMDHSEVDFDRVQRCLQIAGLESFLDSERQGLDTVIGESGTNLSGGQRQRLGLARALYTQPRLLILDEATSQLDASTEAALTRALDSLRGSTTILAVAHRLTTVRHADSVVYLKNGHVVAHGTFHQVRKAVPDFDASARLLGL